MDLGYSLEHEGVSARHQSCVFSNSRAACGSYLPLESGLLSASGDSLMMRCSPTGKACCTLQPPPTPECPLCKCSGRRHCLCGFLQKPKSSRQWSRGEGSNLWFDNRHHFFPPTSEFTQFSVRYGIPAWLLATMDDVVLESRGISPKLSGYPLLCTS